MTPRCLVCLQDIPGEARSEYHPHCAKSLFGSTHVPAIDLDLAKFHTMAQAMVGRSSLSGIQRKVSVELTTNKKNLKVATESGHFILKPQAQTFPHLPENEHVTMQMAKEANLTVPPHGLVRLKDGSLAYLVRRFDRALDGAKLLQEDFCQLGELAPKQKYEGSAELCLRLIRRYATEPGVAALALFRQIVFAWLTGNGDMHLKNLSLLRGQDGIYRLSPAYDLLCTNLVIDDDPLALPVGGNRREITPSQWLKFASYCGLLPKATSRVLNEIRASVEPSLQLLQRCHLPAEMQIRFAKILTLRSRSLEGAINKAAKTN